MRTKSNRIALKSVCPVCGAKKSRFISMQEAKESEFLGVLKSLFGFGAANTDGAITGVKRRRRGKQRRTKEGGLGPMAGMMLGSLAAPLVGSLLDPVVGKLFRGEGLRLPGTACRGISLPGTAGIGKKN